MNEVEFLHIKQCDVPKMYEKKNHLYVITSGCLITFRKVQKQTLEVFCEKAVLLKTL